MSVSPSGKVAPPPAKKVVSVAPTHPVAKAIVAAVHKAVTPIAKKLNLPVRPYGMHPLAFALYVKSGLPVSRIGQTIGNAKASAGTHCKTGEYQGHDYGACFDAQRVPRRQHDAGGRTSGQGLAQRADAQRPGFARRVHVLPGDTR
jgi:hypothetical protein